MASLLDAQIGPSYMDPPCRLAIFLAFFPALFASCAVFLLVSGILVFPVGLAWFINIAAQEDFDFFSFPMILQSVVEEIAVLVGLEQQQISVFTNQVHNDYSCVSMTKPVHPRRESFISDFNEPEEAEIGSRGSPGKSYYSSTGVQVTPPKTASIDIPCRASGFSVLSTGIDKHSRYYSPYQSPSPSYHSATSVLALEGWVRTPDQMLFDFSRQIISPHWSVGRPINKSGTPSPFRLSPGELEYPDSCMPSPKRWPSPVSDAGSFPHGQGSLRAKLQKPTFSGDIEPSERIFLADNLGNNHLYEMDTSTHADIEDFRPTDCLSQDHGFQTAPQRLEGKPFDNKNLVDMNKFPLEDYSDENMKVHNISPVDFNKETALTFGWSHRYKNLIVELKESLEKQENEDEISETGSFNPITDIDPHWMDVPRLSPLERPRFNKLQRWGLVRTCSRANLKDEVKEECDLRSNPNDLSPLEVSPISLKEDYNFGNLELSPEKSCQSPSDYDGYSKSYWEGFDEAYNIRESRYLGDESEDEEKWKLSMGKWAEKGVEVMKPVNEESRENPEENVPTSPSSTKAVHWSSPLSDSSEREPLLLFHDPLAIDDENGNESDYFTHIEDRTPRTPSPLSPLGIKVDRLANQEFTPLEETSNRLFGRRIARAARLPASSSPILTTPPRPLPEKLIRMFEDLCKPQPISPRPSSINSSPERVNCSPEGSYGKETRRVDLGDTNQTTPSLKMKKSVLCGKRNDDGFNECF